MPSEPDVLTPAANSAPPALPASLHMAVHASLESVEARWREAWPRMAATAFQSFDWVRIWYETLGRRQGWKPCIGELRADSPDGPTVLLLPLGFRREGLLRVMGFLGAELLDYQAPLIDPDFARAVTPAHAARMWRGLIDILPSVDVVRTRRMPETIGGVTNPFANVPGARHTEFAHAAMLPATFADYAAERDSGLLANTRRKMRRLSEAGTVRLVTRVETPADYRLAMDAMVEQKSARWRATGAVDAFALPGYREFFERLATEPLQGVTSVASVLLLDEKPLATHWGMQMGGVLYWLMPSYDTAHARFSPGRLLMEALLRRCIEDGLSEFDFTAGDEGYKQQWANRDLRLFSLYHPCSTLGRYASNLRRVMELARGVPALRKLVRKVRGKGPV